MNGAASAVKQGQFYEILPDKRWAFFVDHHMLNTFSTCEQLFKYSHVRHLRGKSRPFGMAVGQWWSEVMSEFYEALAEDQRDPLKLGEVDNEPIFLSQNNAPKLNRGFVLGAAKAQWALLKMNDLEREAPNKFKRFGGEAGAMLMADSYYHNFADLDRRSWKIVATEAGFGLNREVLVAENNEVVVYYVGKPDLMVMENGPTSGSVPHLMPVDHKIRDLIDKDVHSMWKPCDQFPGYIIAAQLLAKQVGLAPAVRCERCIVNVCARLDPEPRDKSAPKRARFVRSYPSYSVAELEEWRKRKLEQCLRLKYCIQHDVWGWKETSCHSQYGRPCVFRGVDSVAPAAREFVIKADFTEVEAWRPYNPEE